MTREQRPYSRLYWSVIDDDKFVSVYDNDRAFATWARLLMAADQAWPASASIPRAASRTAIALLVTAGLIELMPGGRYRIVGMDAERERRQGQAQDAAEARWGHARSNAASNAGADARRMPSQDETRRDEKQRDEPSAQAGEDADASEPDAADAYYLLTTRFPTDKVLTWLDDLSGRFGTEAVCRGLATAWTAERQPSTLLGRVQDALRSEARKLDRKEADEERERLRQKRLTPRVTPMDLEFREALLKRYEHFGKGAA